VDYKVWMYLVYLAISIGLTVWVASTLSRNGLVFLEDVFGDERLARAVNRLLVVGFYLVNLGYVAVAMRTHESIDTIAQALEALSRKVGTVLLVLGALHLFNVFALGRYRRSRQRRRETQPPAPPAGYLPVAPPIPPYPSGGTAAPETPAPTGGVPARGAAAASGATGASGAPAAARAVDDATAPPW
jgi:hypothetical protein